MSKAIDITGMKSERLTAIQDVGSDGRRRKWLCRCDCGNEVVCKASEINAKTRKSCGCLKREKAIAHATALKYKHGFHGHPLYGKWKNMRRRCNNPNDKSYKNYGGRGISVCEEWNDFGAFLKWATEYKWEKGLTIERIDNNKGYCPENCRFASPAEQVRNRRKTIRLEYKGETKALTEWCEIFKLNKRTCYGRLHYYGWVNAEEILFGKGAK